MIFPLSWAETKISYAGASISVEYFDSLWVHFLWKRASWPNAVEKSLKLVVILLVFKNLWVHMLEIQGTQPNRISPNLK